MDADAFTPAFKRSANVGKTSRATRMWASIITVSGLASKENAYDRIGLLHSEIQIPEGSGCSSKWGKECAGSIDRHRQTPRKREAYLENGRSIDESTAPTRRRG